MKQRIEKLLKEYTQRVLDLKSDKYLIQGEYLMGIYQAELDSFEEVVEDLEMILNS